MSDNEDYLFWYSFDRLQYAVMNVDQGFQAGLEALVPDGIPCWNLDLALRSWFMRPEGAPKIVAIKDTDLPNEIKLLCTLLNLTWRTD
jgi:hypothetical protein